MKINLHVRTLLKKQNNYLPIVINSNLVPYANTAKYIEMTLDAKLNSEEHVKKKHQELNLSHKKMSWLMGPRFTSSTYNKLVIFKQLLKSIWIIQQ